MAEDFGAFEESPVASDLSYARLQRRSMVDGVVQDGPDAMGQLLVTATGTSQLTVAPGYASVGGWFYRSDTAQTINVPPNTASSARRDLVVVRADTSESRAYPHIIEGVPGGTSWPEPTRNPGGVWDTVLTRYTIQGNSSVVVAGDLDNAGARQWTVPTGALPCTSTSRPAMPFAGMQILETDTGRVSVWDGETWRVIAETGFPSSWQPITLRSGYGTPGHGRSPSWQFWAPGVVRLRGTISRNNGAALPNNDYYARMPAAARPNAWVRGVGAAESRNSGGSWGATCRLEVASMNATNRLPGQLIAFHEHAPRWIALDGFIYDV